MVEDLLEALCHLCHGPVRILAKAWHPLGWTEREHAEPMRSVPSSSDQGAMSLNCSELKSPLSLGFWLHTIASDPQVKITLKKTEKSNL